MTPCALPPPLAPPASARPRRDGALLAVVVGAVLCALWDATTLDLQLARWYGNAGGFALRDAWLYTRLLHDDVRLLGWVIATALIVGVWLPWGPMRRIDLQRRVALAVALLASVAVVSIAKRFNHTSCPWDLAEFGGVARYVAHWRWGVADGGSGHCFPGGHASTGFGFLALYFAWRDDAPRLARACLVAALVGGFALGWVQQMRGAHFMSHNLWTAWLCWTTAWAVDAARRRFFSAPA